MDALQPEVLIPGTVPLSSALDCQPVFPALAKQVRSGLAAGGKWIRTHGPTGEHVRIKAGNISGLVGVYGSASVLVECGLAEIG